MITQERTAAAVLLLLAVAARCCAARQCGAYGWGTHPEPTTFEEFCTWSGFVSLPYVPKATVALVTDLIPRSCDDKRLSPADKQHCRACCALTTREACLRGVARTWNDGADIQSCNWMSYTEKREKVREVEYTLGINFPYVLASRMSARACSQTREFEVLSPPEAYSTSYFTLMGATDDPDDKMFRPLGLAPDASCIVRAPQRKCSFLFHNSDDVHFILMSRDIWTMNQTIIRQLQAPGNKDCQYDPTRRCVPANPPFRYRTRITDHPCPFDKTGKQERPPEVVVSYGPMPMGEPGALLMPGGSPLNYRETGFYLEGALHVNWTVKAQRHSVLVMVVPEEVAYSVCPLRTEVCDYRKVWAKAVQSTLCFNKECHGQLRNRKDGWTSKQILWISYLDFPNKEEFWPQRSPKQTVDVKVVVTPPHHYDVDWIDY